MKQTLLALIVAVSLTGCASLRQANGSLNVVALVADAQWGVLAACSQEWLTPDACTFATDALTLASTIASKNAPGAQAAVRQSLQDAVNKLPPNSRVIPYLAWLIQALGLPNL